MPKVNIIQTQIVPNWNVDANGNWFTGSNWSPQIPAGGYDRDANFTFAFTANRTITINDHVTLRNLTLAPGSPTLSLVCSTGKMIYFNSKTTCNITTSGGVNHQFSSTNSGETVLMVDMTINNSTRFDWNAKISGTISNFIKNGGGQLNLSNTANSFIAAIKVTAGSIVPTSDACLGNSSNTIELAGGALTLSGAGFTLNRAITVSSNSTINANSNPIISGSIILNAQLTISNSAEILSSISGSGNILVTTGTLKISGTHSGTGNISPAFSSRTLLVTGSITSTSGTIGSFNVIGNGTINKAMTPALIQASDASNNPATLTLGNNLTMGTGASTTVRTNGSSVSKIDVTGNYTAKGTFDFPDASLNTGTYDLITWTGTLTNNSPTLGTNSTGKTITLNIDTVNKKIQAIVT